jgi:hypothetical protein
MYIANVYAVKLSDSPTDTQSHHNRYILVIKVIGKHQRSTNFPRVANEARTCFPNAFRGMNMDGGEYGSDKLYKATERKQNKWINEMIQYSNNSTLAMNDSADYSSYLSSKPTLRLGTSSTWKQEYCLLQAMLHEQQQEYDKSQHINTKQRDFTFKETDQRKIEIIDDDKNNCQVDDSIFTQNITQSIFDGNNQTSIP